MGGGLPFYEMNPRYKELFQNVRYDTAANPLLYDIKSIKTVISMVGPNRLLYGSDFPLLLYPSVKREMVSLYLFMISLKMQTSQNRNGLNLWAKICWNLSLNINKER